MHLVPLRKHFLTLLAIFTAFAFIVFALLAPRFFELRALAGEHQNSEVSAWLASVGEGFVAPACGSASTDQVYCSGGSSRVDVSWEFEDAAAHGCTHASIILEQFAGGRWQGINGVEDRLTGLGCTDEHTFADISYWNNPHRYTVYWWNNNTALEQKTHQFTSANCSSPTASFTATPSTINAGEQSRLEWSSNYTTSCSVTPGGYGGTSNTVYVSPSDTQQYTLTCMGTSGTPITKQETVTVNPPTPSVVLVVSDTEVSEGEQPTIQLQTHNVQLDPAVCDASTPCKCTVSYTNNVGYSGTITTLKHRPYNSATGNYEVQGADPGYTYVTPQPAATTYTAQCLGVDGNYAEDTATINVAPTLAASCAVSPGSAAMGQSVTWTAEVSGGTGSYTYLWSGDGDLEGKTTNPVTVSYTSSGVKSGAVRVTSGSQSAGIIACTTGGGPGGGGSGTVTISEPQCDDGIDNDGDGFIDFPDDLGCSTENENSETLGTPSGDIDASPKIVNEGSQTLVRWGAEGDLSAPATAQACRVREGAGGPVIGSGLTGSVPRAVNQTTSFVLECHGDGLPFTEVDTVVVRLNPNYQEE